MFNDQYYVYTKLYFYALNGIQFLDAITISWEFYLESQRWRNEISQCTVYVSTK